MNLPSESRCAGQTTGFISQLVLLSIVFEIAGVSMSHDAFAEWPFERGDATASGVAHTQFPAEPKQLWRFEADESGFEATAVISQGKVYVGDFDGTFYALHLNDGSEIWKKKFENSGFLSAAAIVEGRVYVGDYNGVVRCLNSENGDELWRHQARGECYAGPNVLPNRVLVTTEAGELLSLDPNSGKVQWRFEIEAPLRCWPTVVDGSVLLAGCDSRLHAVDPQTGKEINGVDLDGQTGATPARWRKSVFFGTVSGTFYRIQGTEIIWQYRDDERLQQIFSAALDQRAVVYSNKAKRVYALDPISGEPKWQFPVRTSVESAPVIVGDTVYFGTKRGRLYGLDVATGKERWQFEAGGGFVASPAVSDGRLIVGNTDGNLYCFGQN